MEQLNHPNVRWATVCPLCLGDKGTGLEVCWPCWGKYGMQYGNPKVERILDEAEKAFKGTEYKCPCGSREAPGHQCWP